MERISKLPEGAVQIHFGSPESNLEMMLEDIFQNIRERYLWQRKDWTDPKYGDAITREEFDKLWHDLWLNQCEGIEEGWV